MTFADKAALRRAALAAREIAHGQSLDEVANTALVATIEALPNAGVIAGYVPIRTEISPLPTMTILHGMEKRICVPVIAGVAQPLKFHEWVPGCHMVDGPFGTQVPKAGAGLVPDLLIMPLVAFDATGTRLGYGGGFYDRSLKQIATQKFVRAVGFAYNAQEMDTLPREVTDWPLDMIVTETGLRVF
ncbi:MAG: 5-formyltetrahydrofolate cyclo-ligase [Rhodobacteraceae bacterium]|nr:5-formyltetrahydrofolate cyclo-ligase [Paracoccaceae bacterium]